MSGPSPAREGIVECCKFVGCDFGDFCGEGRVPAVVFARSVVWALVHEAGYRGLRFSWTEIARA